MFQVRSPLNYDASSTSLASPLLTFQDATDFVMRHPDWPPPTRTVLKTALRQIAWSLALIRARKTGQHLDPDRKALDLAAIAFDIPSLNQTLTGISYRLAGFNSDKSFRNAKSVLRRIARAMGTLASDVTPELPPDSAYQPLLAQATCWSESAVRLFAARLHQQGTPPHAVTDETLAEHAAFLRTQRIGVRVRPTLRRILQTWRRAAAQHPDWPQTRFVLPTLRRPASPPVSVYPASVQQEIETVRRWMEGARQSGPFDGDFAHRPFRPGTVAHRLNYLRVMLGILVERGTEPQAITSLQRLLEPATAQAVLQALRERGQQRRVLLPARERTDHANGSTGQTHAAGQTLMMLATHCFPQPPAMLKQLDRLAKAVRVPKQSEISRKNRTRLEQFKDPARLGRLLALPQMLMDEAVTLRQAGHLTKAARVARAAILFATEIRIPLRIKNLQSCRLGHNLRFAGAQSQVVTLCFQADETKNSIELEFFVGSRLCALLQLYIRHFLPVLAAQSPDWPTQQWLFPAGNSRPGPLAITRVREIITKTAAQRVGAVFHPHLFRALAVMLCLQHSPNALEQCRQLLGDKTMQVVLMHYVPVQRREAAAYLDRLVSAEEERLATLTAARSKRQPRQRRPS